MCGGDSLVDVASWEASQPGRWLNYPEVVNALYSELDGVAAAHRLPAISVFYVCGTDHAKSCDLYSGFHPTAGVVVVPRQGETPEPEDPTRLVFVAKSEPSCATFSSSGLHAAIATGDEARVRAMVSSEAAANLLLQPDSAQYDKYPAEYAAMGVVPDAKTAKQVALLERLATLPEHLRLGVTLRGMRELLSQLPSDAVEQVNAKIPLDKVTGEPKFPKNVTENGYVNQFFVALWALEDKLAVCERLRKRGSPHVGKANVFVSWFLDTPIATLLDALANFLKQKGLREEDTFFWVCDYVIRQTDVKTDLAYLGDCVSVLGHTVLLLEPWDDPKPLKRAYCIKEVYHTQASGAQFDMVMSSAQQASFDAALVADFKSIQMSVSKVDVRLATCRNAADTDAILEELHRGIGLNNCNALVIGVLRDALVRQAQVALVRLPDAERGTSTLIKNMGMLLQDMGKLMEARPLLEEALQAHKKTLGNHHPDTLRSINNMAKLLEAMGQLKEAMKLYEEELQAQKETLGDRHKTTLTSIHTMGLLLVKMGQLKEARSLLEEALKARRGTLGDGHLDTLTSIDSIATLLKGTGQLEEAKPLYEEALLARRKTLSNRHPTTLLMINNLGALLIEMGQLEEARSLFEEALQAQRERFGESHPRTQLMINNMNALLSDISAHAGALHTDPEAAVQSTHGKTKGEASKVAAARREAEEAKAAAAAQAETRVAEHTHLVTGILGGNEPPEEKLIKLDQTLRGWKHEHTGRMEMLFHYTSCEVAELIIKDGFQISDIGMGGKGAYFTTLSPSQQIDSASWPSVQFRENLLKANFGDDWDNLSRQQSADAVVVCFIDRQICEPVPGREEARVVHPHHLHNTKSFVAYRAVQLYAGKPTYS